MTKPKPAAKALKARPYYLPINLDFGPGIQHTIYIRTTKERAPQDFQAIREILLSAEPNEVEAKVKGLPPGAPKLKCSSIPFTEEDQRRVDRIGDFLVALNEAFDIGEVGHSVERFSVHALIEPMKDEAMELVYEINRRFKGAGQ